MALLQKEQMLLELHLVEMNYQLVEVMLGLAPELLGYQEEFLLSK